MLESQEGIIAIDSNIDNDEVTLPTLSYFNHHNSLSGQILISSFKS